MNRIFRIKPGDGSVICPLAACKLHVSGETVVHFAVFRNREAFVNRFFQAQRPNLRSSELVLAVR